jgi:hypothetical protein
MMRNTTPYTFVEITAGQDKERDIEDAESVIILVVHGNNKRAARCFRSQVLV